jgi:hypothetical protein
MKKIEREHLNKVAGFGCIVCHNLGLGETPAEIHHVGNGTLSKRASNYETIPLCPFIIGLVGMVPQSIQAVKHGRKTTEQKKNFLSRFYLWCYNTIGLIHHRVYHGSMERHTWLWR